MKFRKKPIVVDAIIWHGGNHREMFEFLGGNQSDYMTAYNDNFRISHNIVQGCLVIKTSEGEMIANIDDYIIKEPFDKERKYYPCKPDIFKLTYKPESSPLSSEDYYVGIVSELNEELFNAKETSHDSPHCFVYSTTGNERSILFNDVFLWSSEDDEREFIEGINDYEPLLLFVKIKFNQYVESLEKLKM